MTTDAPPEAGDGLDADRVAAWLVEVVDPSLSSVTISRLAGGYSSGAWRLDVVGRGDRVALVLKAPGEPSMVYRRDACREARIMDAVGRMGAPVPAVVAIDAGARATGRPCFVMDLVAGCSVSDVQPGGYHGDGWFRDAGADARRAIWDSFHDALAALHAVDATQVPDGSHGPRGVVDVLGYWRDALLDAAPAAAVPRQLAVLDWLRDHVPPGADDAPAICMGDARLVNCLVVGAEVRALVDFEVAYAGNPAADVGYSLFFDALLRRGVEQPLAGLPSADDTWARWSRATGRALDDRAYWTAFGATVVCVTATRAMKLWGVADRSVESDNLVVGEWESAVARALR
jgi:aminoglycoside phosphotransferase (APT) family kinase protein